MFMTNVTRVSVHLGDVVGKEKGRWRSAHHSMTLGTGRLLFGGGRSWGGGVQDLPVVPCCLGAEPWGKDAAQNFPPGSAVSSLAGAGSIGDTCVR